MFNADWTTKRNIGIATGAGALAGFLCTMFAYKMVLDCMAASFNMFSFGIIHQQYLFIYIADLLPVLAGWGTYVFITKFVNRRKELSGKINEEKQRNESISLFVRKLSKGEFDVDYTLTEENDQLGNSIIELRNYLIKNREAEEIRRKEDAQRNWASEGFAKLGEILRQNNSNLEGLSYDIISNLVKYLNVNQGGFFILRDEEEGRKYFEMTGCYAYERKKFSNKQIEWGEGLIGACALEKEAIYMTDVPDDYVMITSGLGDSNPRCILIVPLLMNEEIQGIIELASFRVLESFEKEFVEKFAESIASTLYSVKSNVQTKRLLEQSQRQAEELSQQEEELRQNIEELRVTQEQIAIQGKEFEVFTNAVNHTMIRAEFNPEGKLIFANDKFIKKLGYGSRNEVDGRHVSTFINPKDQEQFFKTWDDLIASGSYHEGEVKYITKHNKDMWTIATLLCVNNAYNELSKIIFLGIDITDQKELNLNYESQIHALDRSSLKAQFMPDGLLVDCNDVFMEALGFSSHEELKMKSLFDFVCKEELENFKTIWNSALHGEPFKGQLRKLTKSKEERWFQCTLTSVLNIYNEVVKIIYIANDITDQKMMEMATQQQAELLKTQEELLRQSQVDLSIKLDEARKEMKEQFMEIEKIKIRNEKTLEGALDAIFTIDKTGRIEFFNKAAESLWGYDREEIIGKHISTLFSEDIKKTDEMVGSLINGSNKIVGVRKEVKVQMKTGEEKNVLLLLSEAKINDEHSFTAFIQNIEVELF